MPSWTTDDPFSSSTLTPATIPQASTFASLPQPRTPSFGTTTTPTFSSPDTPQQPETPHVTQPETAFHSTKGGGGMVIDPSDLDTETVGLRYGLFRTGHKGKRQSLGKAEQIVERMDLDVASGHSSHSARVSPKVGTLSLDEEDESVSFPGKETLRAMQQRLGDMDDEKVKSGGDGWSQRNELAGMVNSLLTPALEQLPFLQGQIAAQRDTIATIQEQTKLSEQLMSVERERHAAERAGWQAETRALASVREAEIAAGSRPKKLLDLDVGYHQELEAANKRLEMDNRLMAPRLADTQRQIDKLVTELQHLRSHVVLASQPMGVPSDPLDPLQQTSQAYLIERGKSGSPVKASSKHTTMGDARTEHLLLAARKVRAMRQADDRIGRLTLEELKRGGVIGPNGGIGYSEGYGGIGLFEDDEDEYESDMEDEKPVIAQFGPCLSTVGKGKSKGGASAQATPLLPRAKRSSKRSLPPPTTPRARSRAQLPETTPGGSNFTDLLRAAELATRPGTPPTSSSRMQHIPMSAMSATRSTTRTREESMSDRSSPTKRARREPPRSASWSRNRRILGMEIQGGRVEEEVEGVGLRNASGPDSASKSQQLYPEAFALDLLAQASQLDVAQGSASQGSEKQLAGAARSGGVMQEGDCYAESPESDGGESGLAPAIDLKSGPFTAPAPVEDHQIDPVLSGIPHPHTIAETTPRPRTQSFASDVHTPARPFYQHPYPTPENPFAETPGPGESPLPASRNDSLSNELPLGAFASPTGATVPGLGKYVHLTSSMPARRVRSPYLKWTVEEDELLARAVAMHGEKWDLVSKGVPTRSYHQVRQRWLRKTGAFDKKPSMSDHPHGMSGLGQEEEEQETSPTPGGGGGGRKRKL